jgi:AcrR family transcriptional regulator
LARSEGMNLLRSTIAKDSNVAVADTVASPVRRPGRPRVGFDQKRSQIIRSATRLFAQRGFHATSMDDICDKAGIGRGVLYHYVSSKEEILVAVHERFIEPLLERARAIVSAGDPPDVTLRALSQHLMGTMSEYLAEVTVFLHEWKALPHSKSRWRKVREKRIAFERIVQDTVEQGQREGLFRDLDPRLTSLAFLGMHNYAYQWLNPKGRLTPDEIASLFCSIFLDGTRHAPAAS